MCVLVAGLEGARTLDGRTNHLSLFRTMASSPLEPVTVRSVGDGCSQLRDSRMGPTWPPLTAPLHILMTVKYAVR